MSDSENLNHTNDVPITSIQGRSPALWGLLKRTFSAQECVLLDKLFLVAVNLKANDELICRQPGVTFNARLARIIQIAADGLPLTTSLFTKCLIASCSNKDLFINESKKILPTIIYDNLDSDCEFILAQSAAMLDQIRHLHLSNLSSNQIEDVLNNAHKLNDELLLQADNKFKVQFCTAISNAKSRLLK